MKKCLILSFSFVLGCACASVVHAGDCHGKKVAKAPVVVEETVVVVPPAVVVEETVVVPAESVSLRSAFKDANREARATKKAAVLGHRAAKFSRKAADAATQEAKQEAVMKAYDAN